MTDARNISRHQISWAVAIAATVALAIYSTIFSLTHGIYEVFPFLYFLPIIIFVYQYPNRGVLFTLGLSTVFLSLVYYYSNTNTTFFAISTAWFAIFITIGVVTSSFASDLRAEERKYRGIFENSQAGIFTFDLQSQDLLEINVKFARMLSYEREDLLHKNLSSILFDADGKDAFIRTVSGSSRAGDIELYFHTRNNDVRQFLISASLSPGNLVICSAIDITERKIAEQVIAKARDELEQRVKDRTEELLQANDVLKSEIQERKRFEAAIQLANRKLNTLSSITRHDILNQITAIVMYLSLAEETVKDPAVVEQLKKIGQVTDLIQKQIRFTRDYQNIGENAPQWQDVATTIGSAIGGLDLKGIRVEKDLDHLEIFADFLLEKVFYNLVENSVRHGEKATVITFSYRKDGDDLVLVCADDGVGIPADAKVRIFKREYYRNTGYGLFLSGEILSITGLTIRETGEPGSGARFEIRAPKGVYRLRDSGGLD
ncbi:MAG: ATP-binding protein [Methanoregula sp.]|jgi:PAS domain S-box-containing protein